MNHAASLPASFSVAPTAAVEASPAVSGAPRLLLRLEALLVLAGAIVAVRSTGAHWAWFAALFFVPDLAILAYRLGPQRGAAVYNAVHTYVAPALVAAIGAALGAHALLAFASAWAAHIAFDRVMGFGLKYPTAFTATHLGGSRER